MNTFNPEKGGTPEKTAALFAEPSPSYSAFRTSFASLSLHQYDRLRMLQFPESDILALKDIIKKHWPRGLQEERKYGGSYEYKLRGYPWSGQGIDAITSRVLMREILAHLFRRGWILHASTDVSKSDRDTDTLLFRKQPTPPPESEWVAISFNMADRLRFIGADNALLVDVAQLLQSMKLLQAESWKEASLNAREFKINGYPWRPSGESTMTTRMLLLKLLEVLENKGWSLYASIDQSTASKDNSETDSWYCVREKSWVQGSTVFHR
jgi:hypothetical protein